MLITEYFQEIESHIAVSIQVVESSLLKDKRSLHIGIVEGRLSFADESVLYFLEFVAPAFWFVFKGFRKIIEQ